MRLLSVVDGIGWGGTKEQVYLLARELSKKGIQTHMALSFQYERMVERLAPYGVNFYFFENHNKFSRLNLMNYYRLWRIIDSGNFDVVLANSPHTLDFLRVVFQFLKKKPKLIAVKRSARVPNSLSLRFKYAYADMVVAVSESVKEGLTKAGFPNEKISVIESGIDIERFKPNPSIRPKKRLELGIPNKASVFINVANWNPLVKGQDKLIETFLKLKCEGCILLLVGIDTQKYSLKKKGVVGLGFREDVDELLNASDFFILSSYLEGLPNALLQAMACGLVVISTSAGGIRECLMDGYNGFTVKVGDFEELLKKMEKVLKLSYGERKVLSERAAKTAMKYSIETTANEYIKLFQELLQC
ncbi:MAG: glycosyltransferase family 4 protein [Aquificaceae bacterium]